MRIIGGKYAGRRLAKPIDNFIRPTTDRVRESVFNILEHCTDGFFSEKRILDLFAGTGALGFEALSRGAASVVFVDSSVQARALIQKTIESLSLQACCRLLRRDATCLGEAGTMKAFDIVFADPPYNSSLGEKAFVSAHEGGFLSKGAYCILEEALEAQIELPDFFKKIDERIYGQTIIYFYNYMYEG